MSIAYFPATIALDPTNTPQRAAEASVFAIEDVTFSTPLMVTDLNGIPFADNKLRAENFLFPAFLPPEGVSQVIVRSGEMLTPLTSVSVERQAAVEAAAQAAERASEAGTAAGAAAAAREAAESAAEAAEAVGTTNDTVIAGRINDTSSATRTALNTTIDARVKPLSRLLAALARAVSGPVRIVFSGSSTTAGTGASTQESRWVNRFVRAIQGIYPSGGFESPVQASSSATFTADTGPGVKGYNSGEGNTTAATYLTDAESDAIVNELAPDVWFHMVGSNDYATNVDPAAYEATLLSRIAYINAELTNPCVHVFVHAYQRDGSFTHPWSRYGAALRNVAAEVDGVFINLSGDYAAIGIPGSDIFDFIYDGVHQTDAGHAFMADLVVRALGLGTRKADSAPAVSPARVWSDGFSGAAGVWSAGRTADLVLGGSNKELINTTTKFQLDGAGGLTMVSTADVQYQGFAIDPTVGVQTSFDVAAVPSAGGQFIGFRSTLNSTGERISLEVNINGVRVVKRIGSTTFNGPYLATAAGAVGRWTLRLANGFIVVLYNGVVVSGEPEPAHGSLGFLAITTSAAAAAGGTLRKWALDVLA